MMHSALPSGENPLPVIRSFLAQSPAKPLIVILGPTASGKTSFSISLAKEIQSEGLQPEIVNGDSRQLYKFLDIGTAKITEKEMEGIPHHLFSILDPKQPSTIADYQRDAMKMIENIQSRGGIPMLVGGSMLYISSIIDGLQPVSSDPALREKLGNEYDLDAGKTLHARLASVDLESAAGIPVQDKTYLVRAMEIFESTGVPKSEQKKKSECPYDLLIFGIDLPREELYERINARTAAMFDHGWIDEVESLKERGYSSSDPAMQSHGYKALFQYVEFGGDLGEMEKQIATQGRQYAKRQLTLWRGDPRIQWITPRSIH